MFSHSCFLYSRREKVEDKGVQHRQKEKDESEIIKDKDKEMQRESSREDARVPA